MVLKTSQLKLYREIIAVCSKIHTKHVNALWAEHRIFKYQSCWYIKSVLGFKRLNKEPENVEEENSSPCNRPRNPRGGVEVYPYSFFNLHRRGSGWSTPRPRRFTPGKKYGTHCIGGWVGPRTGLDGCGKSRLHRDSIPELPSP